MRTCRTTMAKATLALSFSPASATQQKPRRTKKVRSAVGKGKDEISPAR